MMPVFIFCFDCTVDLDDKPSEMSRKASHLTGPVSNSISTKRDQLGTDHKDSSLQTKHNFVADGVKMSPKYTSHSPVKRPGKECGKSLEDSGSDSDTQKNVSVRNLGKIVEGRQTDGLEQTSELIHDTASDPTLPTEVIMM